MEKCSIHLPWIFIVFSSTATAFGFGARLRLSLESSGSYEKANNRLLLQKLKILHCTLVCLLVCLFVYSVNIRSLFRSFDWLRFHSLVCKLFIHMLVCLSCWPLWIHTTLPSVNLAISRWNQKGKKTTTDIKQSLVLTVSPNKAFTHASAASHRDGKL